MSKEAKFENELQELETAIIDVYRNNPDLVDSQVERAISASVYKENSNLKGKQVSPHNLSGLDLVVFENIQEVNKALVEQDTEFSPAELVQCLKRIKKSVQRWNRKYGRQGYLNFVNDYV